MINTVPAGRKNRAGTGVLPPNSKQWDCENNGLDLRRDLGIAIGARLSIADAFACLPGARVIPHGELACAEVLLKHFRSEASGRWSGLAMQLDDGTELIIYNDSHAETRVRASLMEEFFHVKLDHPRSRMRPLPDGSRQRTLDSEIERIAYGSGAASLVPYCGLKELMAQGAYSNDIARLYGVSPQLIAFRMKVTRLYNKRRGK
jgi:hypothetical protein